MNYKKEKVRLFNTFDSFLDKIDKKQVLRRKIFRKSVVEFYLPEFNEDLGYAWHVIRHLYYKILKNDPEWHFFYEGQYTIIRCQFRFYNKVVNFFNDRCIKYKYKGKWVDGSYVVRKYNKFFKPLFHMYSHLSLGLNEDDLYFVSDRVIHCFFNHQTYMAKEHVNTYGPFLWEAEFMGKLSTNRSIYSGKVDYYNKLEDLKKSKKKESKCRVDTESTEEHNY